MVDLEINNYIDDICNSMYCILFCNTDRIYISVALDVTDNTKCQACQQESNQLYKEIGHRWRHDTKENFYHVCLSFVIITCYLIIATSIIGSNIILIIVSQNSKGHDKTCASFTRPVFQTGGPYIINTRLISLFLLLYDKIT